MKIPLLLGGHGCLFNILNCFQVLQSPSVVALKGEHQPSAAEALALWTSRLNAEAGKNQIHWRTWGRCLLEGIQAWKDPTQPSSLPLRDATARALATLELTEQRRCPGEQKGQR